MRHNEVKTFTATIYCGLHKERTGDAVDIGVPMAVVSEYCLSVGLCVSFTQTTFVYKAGSEPGVIIGLINYPRFPSYDVEIRKHALRLAESLMIACSQMRVSVVFPDNTVMLSSEASIQEDAQDARLYGEGVCAR